MELTVDMEKKLNGFYLKVKFNTAGEVLGLLGASGSGKSMTLRCIAGLERPTRGKIVLNDRVLYDSERGIDLPARKRKVGFLFQQYALFPHMTVVQNIGFGLEGMSKGSKEEKVRNMLGRMHLEGLENRYPSQLSGGQQQRVALARALAIEPEVLLLDEPFSALDNHLRSQMENQLLETLAEYSGVTLFVSHNMEEVYRICEKLVVMSEGSVAASGPKVEIFQNPPTFSAAQLTGCKNISVASLDSEGVVEAQDWGGCRVRVEKPLDSPFSYIGIRARHIRQVERACSCPNVFACRPAKVVEGPHSVTVLLHLENHAGENKEGLLQWEVSRERWQDLKSLSLPWHIELPPEKVFIIP